MERKHTSCNAETDWKQNKIIKMPLQEAVDTVEVSLTTDTPHPESQLNLTAIERNKLDHTSSGRKILTQNSPITSMDILYPVFKPETSLRDSGSLYEYNHIDAGIHGDVMGGSVNQDTAPTSECVSWIKMTLMPPAQGSRGNGSDLTTQQRLPAVNLVDQGTQTHPSDPPRKCESRDSSLVVDREHYDRGRFEEGATQRNHEGPLFERIWEFQKLGKLCDLTLEMDDGSVRCHRLVLAASSPVLLTMCTGHAESPGTLRLSGVCLADCAEVVRYIYTGKMSVDKDRISSVLDLCEMFNLKGACELYQKIQAENNTRRKIGSMQANGLGTVTHNICKTKNDENCVELDASPEQVEGILGIDAEEYADGNDTEGDTDVDFDSMKSLTSLRKLRPRLAATNCRTRATTQRSLRKTRKRKIEETSDNCDKSTGSKEELQEWKSPAIGTEKVEGDPPSKRKRGRPQKVALPPKARNLKKEQKTLPKYPDVLETTTPQSKTPEDKEKSPVERSSSLNARFQHHLCQKDFGSKSELKKHISKCGLVTVDWACKKCDEIFETKGELVEHNRKHRHLKCHRCHIKFETLEELEEHRMQEHRGRGKNQMYTCDKCGKTFTERNNLVVHQYKNHWTEGMEEPKVLVCQVEGCKFKTTRRGSMYVHKFKHTDERSFMCDLCGACFKNRIYLKQHTNGMHSKEKVEYKCSQCEAVFKRQLGLTIHEKRVHQNVGPQFMCNHCPHMAFSKINLYTHMFYKHNIPIPGVQIHVCPECGYKSHSSTLMNRHIARHSADRRFVCDVCKKAYCTDIDLRSHKARHDASKKLQCKYCDYSTAYGPKRMREHITKQHEQKEVKPWNCHVCKYRTNEKGNLTKHIRNVHKLDVQSQRHIVPKTAVTEDVNNMMIPNPRFRLTLPPVGVDVRDLGQGHPLTSATGTVLNQQGLPGHHVMSGTDPEHQDALVNQRHSEIQLRQGLDQQQVLQQNDHHHQECLTQEEHLHSENFQPQILLTMDSPQCHQTAPVFPTVLPPGAMSTEPTYPNLLVSSGLDMARSALDYTLASPFLPTDSTSFMGYPK